MHFPFIHPVTNHQEEQAPLVVTHEPESLSMEGSEFLDDGLRMEDMAFRTEESVAVGTPKILL